MKVIECFSESYEVQLRETFKTALREINSFKVFRITVVDEAGVESSGECVSTPAIVGDDFDLFETIFQNEIRPLLLSSNIEAVRQLHIWPSLKSAADCAWFGPQKSSHVATDVTVPICEVVDLPRILERRVEAGFSSLKIKLGAAPLQSNVDQIHRIRDFVGDQFTLRIDPNQAWNFEYSAQFFEALGNAAIALDYVEQPVPACDFESMKKLKEMAIYEVMADESCFSIDDAKRLIDDHACDWINIKLLKTGGATKAQAIARLCKESDMKFSVGSMLESPLGVGASIAFAQEVAPEVVHDLDAAWWYASDNISYSSGIVSVR